MRFSRISAFVTAVMLLSVPMQKFSVPVLAEERSEESMYGTIDLLSYTIREDNTVKINFTDITEGDIVIPAEIEGFPVTELGDNVFQGRENITSVILPDSITMIGNNAFSGCTFLTSVNIPANLKSLGAYAFENCPITEAVLPETLESVGAGAFSGCSLLKELNIPDSVSEIGGAVCSNCTSLESLKLSAQMTELPKENSTDFLENCISLKSITIPENLTKIESNPFKTCTALETIEVDENNQIYTSVDGILCTKTGLCLTAYPAGKTDKICTLPEGITKIGTSAFCNTVYLEELILPSTLDRLGIAASAFLDCKSLKKVVIPEGIINLAAFTFWNCQNLKEIVLPESLYSVMNGAFLNCSSLENIIIPDNVSKLDSNVFSGCTSLKSVTLGTGIKEIGSSIFKDCENLTDIYYTGTQEQWEKIAIQQKGNEIFQNVQIHFEESAPEILTGDINQDGQVSVSDVIFLQKYLHGQESFTKAQFQTAELTQDGKVNIFDFIKLKYLLLETK